MICLTETHLEGDNVPSINNFSGFALNRPTKDKKAWRNSGGISIMFNTMLQRDFNIEKCYTYDDKVLGISLTHKLSGEVTAVYCVYLPPDSSKYSSYNEQTLNNLTIEVYARQNYDNIFVCGDFNARLGRQADVLGCDDLNSRMTIDETFNSQGDKLLTFINDIRGCVVNG